MTGYEYRRTPIEPRIPGGKLAVYRRTSYDIRIERIAILFTVIIVETPAVIVRSVGIHRSCQCSLTHYLSSIYVDEIGPQVRRRDPPARRTGIMERFLSERLVRISLRISRVIAPQIIVLIFILIYTRRPVFCFNPVAAEKMGRMGPGIPQFSVCICTHCSCRRSIKNCFPLMPCRIGSRGKIGSSTSVCARSDKRILASPLIKQAVQADRPFGRRGVRPQIVFHNCIMIGRCRREIILSRDTRTQGIGIIRIVILVRIVTSRPNMPTPSHIPVGIPDGNYGVSFVHDGSCFSGRSKIT